VLNGAIPGRTLIGAIPEGALNGAIPGGGSAEWRYTIMHID